MVERMLAAPGLEPSRPVYSRVPRALAATAAAVMAVCAGPAAAQEPVSRPRSLWKPEYKQSPLASGEVEKLVADLAHPVYATRAVAQRMLYVQIDERVLIRLAACASSPDSEQRSSAERIVLSHLPHYLEAHHPLPAHIGLHWLWLEDGKQKKEFNLQDPHNPHKVWSYSEIQQAYLRRVQERGVLGTVQNDWKNYREALVQLCRYRRDTQAWQALHRLHAEFREWQALHPDADEDSWKQQRYRDAMQSILQDVEAYAEPFIESSEQWRRKNKHPSKR